MQSLRVVDKLEKEGRGLNLTWEVRNGIVTHTKGTWAATPEGDVYKRQPRASAAPSGWLVWSAWAWQSSWSTRP